MKFAAINKRFTEIVAEYIAQGYVFNTSSMAGHEGEVAKVDLTDGTEIIRIVLRRFYESDLEGLHIVVGRSTDNVVPNDPSSRGEVWTSQLAIVFEEKYYALNNRRSRRENPFYGTLEEATAASDKRMARYVAKHVYVNMPLTPSATLIRNLKKRKGFTNATRTNITVSRVHNGYQVTMAGRNGGSNKNELIRLPGIKTRAW